MNLYIYDSEHCIIPNLYKEVTNNIIPNIFKIIKEYAKPTLIDVINYYEQPFRQLPFICLNQNILKKGDIIFHKYFFYITKVTKHRFYGIMIMDGYFATLCSNVDVKIYDNRLRILKFNFDNYSNIYSNAKQFEFFNRSGGDFRYKIIKKNKQNKYKNYYHTTFINDGAKVKRLEMFDWYELSKYINIKI